ncbi:MAG TPA: response regulator [Candidatus Bathyarchaeia archaeon]
MEKQKKTILIIDDDKSIQQIFARILKKQGYDTDNAETGQEALEKLRARKYSLALIDIKLPDTNGTDLITRIHAIDPSMIKIAITGFPSIEDATRVIDRGASAYLVKPVKAEELIKIISEKLNSQEEHHT